MNQTQPRVVCPDCGASCVEKESGVPPQRILFSLHPDHDTYHDNTECIRYLKNRLDHLTNALMMKGIIGLSEGYQ